MNEMDTLEFTTSANNSKTLSNFMHAHTHEYRLSHREQQTTGLRRKIK